MLNVSWLEKIASGNYEAELVNLTLTNGYGDRFDGHGKLSWTIKDGLQIDAWTDGAEILLKKYCSRIPCPPGQIIPDKYYLCLDGQTLNKETLVIERILPDSSDYNITAGCPKVVWKIPQSSVMCNISITSKNGSIHQAAQTELLLNPVILSWPRKSHIDL